jgi:SPP1 family predicted phage head-tail adaptor
MKAGILNSRVAIKRLTQVQDETGQMIDDWVTLAEVWANIRHLSGLEAVRQGLSESEVNASIRIRYRSDIDAGMAVVWGGTTYDVRAMLPSAESKEFTDLICKVTT